MLLAHTKLLLVISLTVNDSNLLFFIFLFGETLEYMVLGETYIYLLSISFTQ
jgi:hypothetical protein